LTDFSVGARRASAASCSRVSLRPRHSSRPRGTGCARCPGRSRGTRGTGFALDALQAFGACRARRPGGARGSVTAGSPFRSLGAGSTIRARRAGFTRGAGLAGGSLFPSWASMGVTYRRWPVSAACGGSNPAGEPCCATGRKRVQGTRRRSDRGRTQDGNRAYCREQDAPIPPTAHELPAFLTSVPGVSRASNPPGG